MCSRRNAVALTIANSLAARKLFVVAAPSPLHEAVLGWYALAGGRVQCYEQERPFTPLRLCAACPRVAEMAGLDAVLRIARQVPGEQPCFSRTAS